MAGSSAGSLNFKIADATSHHSDLASSRARHRHSSDPGEGPSGRPLRPSRTTSRTTSASTSKPPKPFREELRRHKALEKAVLKAQQQPSAILAPSASPAQKAPAISAPSPTAPSPQNLGSNRRELSPDQPSSCGPPPPGTEQLFQTLPEPSDPNGPDPPPDSHPGPSGQAPGPSALHAPQGGTQMADPQAALEAIIARAIQQGLAQSFQQGFFQTTSPTTHHQPRQSREDLSEEQHYSPEYSDQGSMSEEEESRELTCQTTKVLHQISPLLLAFLDHNSSDHCCTRPLRSPGWELLALQRARLMVLIQFPLCLRSLQWNQSSYQRQNFSLTSCNDNGLYLDLAQPLMASTNACIKRLQPSPTCCRYLRRTVPLQP